MTNLSDTAGLVKFPHKREIAQAFRKLTLSQNSGAGKSRKKIGIRLVTPVTTRLLGFWRDRDSGSNWAATLLGGGLILLLYGLSIVIFPWLAM